MAIPKGMLLTVRFAILILSDTRTPDAAPLPYVICHGFLVSWSVLESFDPRVL